jgi:hypothetical protein
MSDIEGKVARVSDERVGKRMSFKCSISCGRRLFSLENYFRNQQSTSHSFRCSPITDHQSPAPSALFPLPLRVASMSAPEFEAI